MGLVMPTFNVGAINGTLYPTEMRLEWWLKPPALLAD
jgi:hypothetical protein